MQGSGIARGVHGRHLSESLGSLKTVATRPCVHVMEVHLTRVMAGREKSLLLAVGLWLRLRPAPHSSLAVQALGQTPAASHPGFSSTAISGRLLYKI